MASESQSVGRAKTVLVFGQGSGQKAVISAILARLAERAAGERVRFVGPVEFSRSVQRHVRDTIVPIVDHILAEINVLARPYEISAVNLGVASALDVGTKISGLSADVPMFLALLSAGLGLPVPDNLVSTGHIASVEGDIAAVKAIPAKAQAVVADRSLGRFLYPDLDRDRSLGVLSPREKQRSQDAVMAARDSLDVRPVGEIAELVREVFAEEEILRASLKTGFLTVLKHRPRCANPLPKTIHFLANNRRRFWRLLEEFLLASKVNPACELLRAFAQFHADRQLYPTHTGQRLFHLLCSLHPAMRRLIKLPMIDSVLCVEIAKYARERDCQDVFALLDAVRAKHLPPRLDSYPTSQPVAMSSDPECIAFDAIAARIDERALVRKFGIPIDSARGAYVLVSSTVGSYEEFIDTLAAFYTYLQRHLHREVVGSPDAATARVKASALLEKVFYGEAANKAAYARARDGTDGGMRLVLDLFTEQFKRQEQAEYVQQVFKDALEPMDWNQRVAFMRGAMKRLGPFLPADLRDEPPERFARRPEVIIQVFVESLDRINRVVSTL